MTYLFIVQRNNHAKSCILTMSYHRTKQITHLVTKTVSIYLFENF